MDFIDEVRNADRGRWLVVSDNPDWLTAPLLYGTEIIGEVRWVARTFYGIGESRIT